MDMERRAKEINSIMTADTGYGFKTAQITFEENTTVWGAFIIPKDHFATDSPPFDCIMWDDSNPLAAGTYDLILYKGRGLMFGNGIEVSGNVEELESGVYVVTGNCTVTIPDDDDLG